MNKFLTGTAMAMAISASPAVAGDNTDIDQVLNNIQVALNAISTQQNGNTISQAATNAGNVVSVDFELGTVFQVANSLQVAGNLVATPGRLSKVDQDAVNVANMISVDGQDLGGSVQAAFLSPQIAANAILSGKNVEESTQEATNAVNLIDVRDIGDGGAVQDFFSIQGAGNLVVAAGDESHVHGLTQSATNVANSISARRITDGVFGNDIEQFALGAQVAGNGVFFGDGAVAPIDGKDVTPGLYNATQTAVNAANLINADQIRGAIVQDAEMDQWAMNVAYHTGPATTGSLWDAGAVRDVDQSATNALNVISANSLGNVSGVTDVTQFSNSLQTAVNIIDTQGHIQSVTQSATNVANSISNPVDSGS